MIILAKLIALSDQLFFENLIAILSLTFQILKETEMHSVSVDCESWCESENLKPWNPQMIKQNIWELQT